MKKSNPPFVIILLIGIIGLFLVFKYLVYINAIPTVSEILEQNISKNTLLEVKTPQGSIYSFVASTSEELAKGLGDRDSLADYQGMLFIFNNNDIRGFWMKDMRFPIDIVWINEDKTVAGIARNIATTTYPDLFFSPSKVKYVLEVNAGVAEKMKIATSTTLSFVI